MLISNRSVGEWGDIFGDTMVVTAILARLLHHSTVVRLRGESYRLMEKRRSGLLHKEETSPALADGSRMSWAGQFFGSGTNISNLLLFPVTAWRVEHPYREPFTGISGIMMPSWRVVSSRHKILGNFQQSLYYCAFMRLRKYSETRSKKRWEYCV